MPKRRITVEPAWLTRSSAARYLDTSRETIDALIAAGRLKDYRLNPRGWGRVSRAELDALLADQEATA